MTMIIGLMVPDLMMRSRISGMVTAAGLSSRYLKTVAALAQEGAADELVGLVVDINSHAASLEELGSVLGSDRESGLGQRSLGFFSHVDSELGGRGRAAGFSLVIPRSKLDSVLPPFLIQVRDGVSSGVTE